MAIGNEDPLVALLLPYNIPQGCRCPHCSFRAHLWLLQAVQGSQMPYHRGGRPLGSVGLLFWSSFGWKMLCLRSSDVQVSRAGAAGCPHPWGCAKGRRRMPIPHVGSAVIPVHGVLGHRQPGCRSARVNQPIGELLHPLPCSVALGTAPPPRQQPPVIKPSGKGCHGTNSKEMKLHLYVAPEPLGGASCSAGGGAVLGVGGGHPSICPHLLPMPAVLGLDTLLPVPEVPDGADSIASRCPGNTQGCC